MNNDTPPPLPPATQKSKKKGCLIGSVIAAGVGLLLVILLLPAIMTIFHSPRTTSLKLKGRGIWSAIITENKERKEKGLPLLWPGDLAKQGITFANAEAYFTYLMSDGSNTTVIACDWEQRLVPDLKPESLTAPGLTAAKPGEPVLPENNAWHVVVVSDESPSEMPFLVSRNAKASFFSYSTAAEFQTPEAVEKSMLIPLNKSLIKSHSKRVATWVTYGGATLDARSREFTRARLCPVAQPEGEPPLNVLPAQGGFK